MSKRITKKMITPFEACKPTAAILLVNLFDPQIATTKLFLEAIKHNDLPHIVIGNKMDLVTEDKIQNLNHELGVECHPVSFLEKRNLENLADLVREIYPIGSRISVLGIFNTGKTSLIAHLTGQELDISNMPGTTLEFSEHAWEERTLIDSVGQLIDVNRPLMVGYDFTGMDSPELMFDHAMRLEAEGLLSSIEEARSGFLEAITAIKQRLDDGGKILVTGAGASALVAEEIAGQCYETGVSCYPLTNSLCQASPVSFAKGIAEEEGGLARFIADCALPNDVLIGISASGGTGFVYEGLRRARDKGTLTIAITENRDTPLGANADIIIKSNAKPEGPSSTRVQTTHLAIGHALVCILAAERGLTGEQSIEYMTSEHIATKKMGIK